MIQLTGVNGSKIWVDVNSIVLIYDLGRIEILFDDETLYSGNALAVLLEMKCENKEWIIVKDSSSSIRRKINRQPIHHKVENLN